MRTSKENHVPSTIPKFLHSRRYAYDGLQDEVPAEGFDYSNVQPITFTRRLCCLTYKSKEQAIARHVELGGNKTDKRFRTGRFWVFYTL